MYRKIGKSDVGITPITMGAWAIGGFLWGGNDEKGSIAAVHAYMDNGITSIDTAPVYGFGYSEELVGKAIKNYNRDKIQILTKFGMVWDKEKGDFAFDGKDKNGDHKKIYRYAGYDNILTDVAISLKRLQTDYIDLLQLHWPDSTTPIDETMRALEKLIQDGKVRAAGVCNYNLAQMQEAAQTIRLDSDQVPYSMLKRNIEHDLVPYALENNISIIAYSPMERGLLTGKYKASSKFGEGDHRNSYIHKVDMRKIEQLTGRLAQLATKYNATTAQLVLAWTIQQPAIVTALAGARNAHQAEENSKAMYISISEDDLGLIKHWIEE